MKRHLSIALLLGAFLLSAVRTLAPQEPAKNNTLGIISVPLANVHDRPAPKSGLVTQVLLADEVRILEKQDYRYRIAIPGQENREGWIQQEAVYIPKDKGRSLSQPGPSLDRHRRAQGRSPDPGQDRRPQGRPLCRHAPSGA